MMNKFLLVLIGLLASSVIQANELHPAFPLLDGDGQLVMQTNGPFSGMKTCGECHDAAFIADSSDHAAAGVFGDDEPDCLVCHSDAEGTRSWEPESFNPDGSLVAGTLAIHKPMDENCAQCHGLVSNELDRPLTLSGDPGHRGMTERTGQIISPQKISNSGLNIAGKESLTHAFDIHADRVVGCVNCHYSLNNPVYFQQRSESRPPHLDFDPRRLTSADYLTRPLHQLAKGSSIHGLHASGSENSMRRCESCHDATAVHQWLPYKKGHFAALACESCHVPKMYGPALRTLDQTLVDAKGQPVRHYRDVEGDPATADSLIHGFRPAVLVRENVGGERKLAPFNLVTNWYWTAGSPPEQVTEDQLFEVLYAGGKLDRELQQMLDSDGDGSLDEGEFRLESDAALARARQLLEEAGFANVELTGEVTPYSISHGVVNGQWAIRDCRNCHGADSVLGAPVALSGFLPGGTLPEMTRHAGIGAGGLINFSADGSAWFKSDPGAEGFYILGFSGLDLVDLAGIVMFLGISLGVTVHALARYVSNRRRPRNNGSTRKVHMYDAYERIWHWLQASAILLLIFTGLVIHKPHLFGMFSFEYIVQVHNVLGFILLINAALALFYTLASGTIKRFFPDRDNFVGRVMEQAMFYSKGIFAGDAHPLEKTKQNRLNPLQQITYLAILNILLPAQVITGVLIWGMQEWPQLAAALGGLPVLAPIHTFLAWAFSAFIVMHVYLTTTGETPLSGIKSMISGWEDVEEHHGKTDSVKETAHV
jgi:Ni/Fe-hydrogenase b-type cytochrome subunit